MPAPTAFRRTAVASAAAALALLPTVPLHGAALAVGGEFIVNTTTAFNQDEPAVAMDAVGNSVVVWTSGIQDLSSSAVVGQRFDAAGHRRGSEFIVNTYTFGVQGVPAVAMDARGDFVVTWQSQARDGDQFGIAAQRYDANGVAQGTEFVVNTFSTGYQLSPAIAIDASSGDFVIAWYSVGQGPSGDGIYVQAFDAAGNRRGDEMAVDLVATDLQHDPAVATGPNGGFLVAWANTSMTPGAPRNVQALRFGPDGLPAGDPLVVSMQTTTGIMSPAIALDAAGEFVVTWSSSQDGGGYGVYARRFDASDNALGDEFQVNVLTASNQFRNKVAMDAQGDFTVTWLGHDGDYYGPFARRFAVAGYPLGNEFRLNTTISGYQLQPAIASDADGDLLVAWAASGQDGESYGVVGRRYRSSEAVDLAITQSDSADPVTIGAALTYTLTVANLHPVVDLGVDAAIDGAIGAASAVRVTSTLPTGATFVSASGAGWTCSFSTPTISCERSTPLTAGQTSDVAVRILAPATAGPISHVAVVNADQTDPSRLNNRDVEVTHVECAPSLVKLTAAAFSVTEGAGIATITAQRTGGSCGDVSVQYDSSAGSAMPGTDFTDVTGTLTWADGETGTRSFAVPIIDDLLDENDEQLRVSLSNLDGAHLASPSAARVTIVDNDASPRVNFTASAQSVPETPQLVTVTARLGGTSGRDVSIPLVFTGSATNGGDYFPSIASITIPAGQLQGSADLEIAGDSMPEPNETIVVGMGTVTGATKGSLATHTVTIVDNDTVPTVSWGSAATADGEAINRTIMAKLSVASATTVTVPYTLGGTATPGSDYTVDVPSPITFAPGVTSVSVTIHPVDDTIDEPNETAILTLGTPTGATLGSIPVHTHTIGDND